MKTLVRVINDGRVPFVAGFIVSDGMVTETAPILRRDLLGKDRRAAWEIIKAKSWKVEICST